MVLSDRSIREEVAAGRIGIDPFDDAMVQPGSIDVRVGNAFRVFRNSRYAYIDVKRPMEDLTELVTVTATSPAAAGTVTVSATLDGQAFALPGTIDPFLLEAGDHELRIDATDAYGRETVQLVRFSVHATIEGLICAVQRAVAEGLIDANLENSLLAKLNAAKASRDRGNATPEVNQLAAFTNELAAQRGKKITASLADRATGWTNDLISRIKSGAAR